MGIEECKGANCVTNHEAIGALMDGSGDLAAALTAADSRAQLLSDMLRYQHTVMQEIYRSADSFDPARKAEMLEFIRIKALAALRASAKSGLLA